MLLGLFDKVIHRPGLIAQDCRDGLGEPPWARTKAPFGRYKTLHASGNGGIDVESLLVGLGVR